MSSLDQNFSTSKKKNAAWIKHDTNASSDPKLLLLRADLGFEGLGIFWFLIEHIASSNCYTFAKSLLGAFAKVNNIEIDKLTKVVSDYGLFEQDETNFWSNSLKARLEKLDSISQKRQEIGALGGKCKANSSKPLAIAKQKPSKPLANSSRLDIDKNKIRSRLDLDQNNVGDTQDVGDKNKRSSDLGGVEEPPPPEKTKHGEFVLLTTQQARDLEQQLGKEAFEYYVNALDDYLGQSGGKKKYANHGRVISGWARRDKAELRGPFKPKYFKNQTGPPPGQQNAAQRNQAHNAEVLKNILEQDGYEIK